MAAIVAVEALTRHGEARVALAPWDGEEIGSSAQQRGLRSDGTFGKLEIVP